MTDLKIFTDMIEDSAREQIEHIVSLDAFDGAKIRIMPDVHAGKGCVCGFTADLGAKVIPNLVGVDIGCGVLTVPIGKADIDFARLDRAVRRQIPAGMDVRGRDLVGDRRDYAANDCDPRGCVAGFPEKKLRHFDQSLATLGGGNHFIEIDVDDEGRKYLLIHTGSRNFGKCVCEYWQEAAVRRLTSGMPSLRGTLAEVKRRLVASGEEQKLQHALASAESEWRDAYGAATKEKELAWLDGPDRENYIHDMKIAQRWAALNRRKIAEIACAAMDWDAGDAFDTVHNYLGDDNVIRKSAVSARLGERLVIPMNMRDGTLVCVGKGNPDWNFSAPHGAGRAMSRAAARKTLSMDDFRESMSGIFTTCVSEDTIDESPMSYKPAGKIAEQIGDTVEIERTIRPVYNFKAAERPNWSKK